MLVLWLLLLMTKDCFNQMDAFEKPRNVKHYVEARIDLFQAKQFIESHLSNNMDSSCAENQTDANVNFAVLVNVLDGLVKAELSRPKKSSLHDELSQIVHEYASYGRENYIVIANKTDIVLNDINERLKPFFELMDELCEEEYDCNIILSNALRIRFNEQAELAKLLLRLQKVAKYIIENTELIDMIINGPDAEPYLLQYINDEAMIKFIKKLTKVYKLFK